MVSSSSTRTKVFISYSHKDAKYLEQLVEHLAYDERNNLIETWSDKKIIAGAQWREEIKRAIDSTKVAVLLISSSFLASKFIAENELPPLLHAAEKEGAIILPVIVRPSNFEDTELANFQAVNSPCIPVAKMRVYQRDEFWTKVVREIKGAVTPQQAVKEKLLDNIDIRLAEYVRVVAYRQDTKEANLRRKNDVYAPLYAELKLLRDYIEQARLGMKPGLQWIDVAGEKRPLSMSLPNYELPTFHLWPIFKADVRANDFTAPTCALLDEVQSFAVVYNAAVAATRLPTSNILKPHIDAAIDVVVQSPGFREWQQKNNNQVPWVSQDASEDSLFKSIATAITLSTSTSSTSDVWSKAWIESWPIHQPATLGWLLAKRPDQAASCVHGGCVLFGSPCPPLSWYQGVFQSAWPELKNLSEYQKVWETQDKLFQLLDQAEAILRNGLAQIQELYEGGTPII